MYPWPAVRLRTCERVIGVGLFDFHLLFFFFFPELPMLNIGGVAESLRSLLTGVAGLSDKLAFMGKGSAAIEGARGGVSVFVEGDLFAMTTTLAFPFTLSLPSSSLLRDANTLDFIFGRTLGDFLGARKCRQATAPRS